MSGRILLHRRDVSRGHGQPTRVQGIDHSDSSENLEKKGYVKHEVRGRTFFYQAVDTKRNWTIEAARQLIERFCGGSVKELLVAWSTTK